MEKTTIVGKKILGEIIFNNGGKKNGVSRSQTEMIIDKLLQEIENALVERKEIRFPNFFSFRTVLSKARSAMNLQTGKKMEIPANWTPKVKFSNNLKKKISEKKRGGN